MKTAALSLALACVALLGACGDDPKSATQVLVTVDSDLDVPADIDTVRIRVDDPVTAAPFDSHDFPLTSSEPMGDEVKLPFSMGIAKTGQDSFLLQVIGLKRNEIVVELDWRVSFEDGVTLGLSPFLGEICVRPNCGNGQTCFPRKREDVAAGACAAVPPAETSDAEP